MRNKYPNDANLPKMEEMFAMCNYIAGKQVGVAMLESFWENFNWERTGDSPMGEWQDTEKYYAENYGELAQKMDVFESSKQFMEYISELSYVKNEEDYEDESDD